MRSIFDQWRYIFKNLWFVLPFAAAPAIFLSLSVDFKAVSTVVESFFLGPFELDFTTIFRAWSFIRTDSLLGALYSIFAIFCLIFFTAMLLSLVEKHMRIGKRTLNGVLSEVENHLVLYLCFVLIFVAVYEIWALVLSAVLYMICSIASKTAARILFASLAVVFVFALLYLIGISYLWLPCKLNTGLKNYSALVYSYQLVVGVRWKLLLSLAISYVTGFAILVGCSFGPEWLMRLIAILMYLFFYASFVVRMETLYFETDRLDREDLLRTYMEL